MKQIWELALERRHLDKLEDVMRASRARASRKVAARGTSFAIRKYPPAKVGDRFGDLRVEALVDRTNGRSDERVSVACAFGHVRTVYVFNLRKATRARCPMCP